MAEEESFTFVDRRRTQTEAPPEPVSETVAVAETSEPSGEDWEDAEDEAAAGRAPSAYDLIGYCINLLASQAWQNLGLLADPQTGEAARDLDQAKVAIDTVSDLAARLESAPESQVPAALRRELRTLLNDLRLNYVSQRGQAASPLI